MKQIKDKADYFSMDEMAEMALDIAELLKDYAGTFSLSQWNVDADAFMLELRCYLGDKKYISTHCASRALAKSMREPREMTMTVYAINLSMKLLADEEFIAHHKRIIDKDPKKE